MARRGYARQPDYHPNQPWWITLNDVDEQCPHDEFGWPSDEATAQAVAARALHLTGQDLHRLLQQTGTRGKKNKLVDFAELSVKAQTRVRELGLDERDEALFEFWMGPSERLWCFRSGESLRNFHILWWDPDHKVCGGRPPGTG